MRFLIVIPLLITTPHPHSNWNLVRKVFAVIVSDSHCAASDWAYQTYLPYHSLHGADTHTHPLR